MEILLSAPFLVRILVSLFSILVFQKLTKRLDLALLLGILLLALWTGRDARSMYAIAGARVLSLDMLFLAFVISSVIWLSSLMSQAGVMKELVACLKARLSKRALLATLPAVVGMLPMPAGALFSCPLVEDADESNEVPQELKTRINYWFRHVLEFWWPLYPGVVLAVDMSGMPIWKFVLLLFPLSFSAVFAGYVFLLRRVHPTGKAAGQEAGKSFFVLILPIITVIAVYIFLLLAAPAVGRVNHYLPLAIGMACALLVLQLQRPAAPGVWKKTLWSWKWPALVIIIVLARVYGAFIEGRLADGSFVMDHVRAELYSAGIPALLLVIIIPYVSGLTTGITVGYIGASFPVVLSLAGPTTASLFSTIIIGYVSGYLGMMSSPIHVCLIVTNKYFQTSLAKSLHGLAKPAIMLFALAVLYAGLWRFFG